MTKRLTRHFSEPNGPWSRRLGGQRLAKPLGPKAGCMRRVTIKRSLLIAATAALAVVLVPPIADAHSTVTTIASGLDNPRGLAFGPDGGLYVAEAGKGGAGPCFPSPEGDGDS